MQTAHAAGSGTSGDPFTEAADAYTVTSGRYFFNLGSGTFAADVDNSEGGGWILVLQYVHRGGTTPPVDIVGAGANLPVTSAAALGTDESADTTRWGHAGNAAMSQFTGDIELRWFGRSSSHNRVIHFRSPVGVDHARTGVGTFFGIQNDFTPLTGHSSFLPAAINNGFGNLGDLAFTLFPFFNNGTYHWGIDANANGPIRWEADDFPNGPALDTIHRVWVRAISPLIVSNTNNSGAGSLRDAINFANNNPSEDNIIFSLPGSGPFTITLSSALPDITDDGVTIDGTTQIGASCGNLWGGTPHSLLVRLNGGNRSFDGLTIRSNNVLIRGLSLTGFSTGISNFASAANTNIRCNYVGLDVGGAAAINTITMRIQGNSTIVGGLASDAGNVLSGNAIGIISINGANALALRGNFIGTDPTGLAARANGRFIISNQSGFSTWSDITRNLISGNGSHAFDLQADDTISGASGDLIIAGNYIGVDRTGNAALPNNGNGFLFRNGTGSGIVFGGVNPADRNIISGNSGAAIRFEGNSNVTILGNYIGVGADGVTPVGNNAEGIYLTATTNVRIGDGTNAGSNIIANNTFGVSLINFAQASVTNNRFFGNTNIALNHNGRNEANFVTPNDIGDGDDGANELLNFPVINAVYAEGTAVGFDLNLDAPASAQGYRIEFYLNNSPDPTGHGEGEVYLGFANIDHAGGDINHTGNFTASTAVPEGSSISTTATRITASGFDITSEFSLNYTSVTPTELAVTKTIEVYDPLNEGLFALPGNDVIATQIITNIGNGAVDADSIVLITALADEMIFYNGDIDGDGPANGAISFTQSAGAGLTFDVNNDAAFSDSTTKPANFAACTYTPGADYDPAVTFICINPKGSMAAGDPNPNFTVQYRAMIE